MGAKVDVPLIVWLGVYNSEIDGAGAPLNPYTLDLQVDPRKDPATSEAAAKERLCVMPSRLRGPSGSPEPPWYYTSFRF